MTVKKLESEMFNAFDAHAAALEGGHTLEITKAWQAYAKAKNAYLEAYHGGKD